MAGEIKRQKRHYVQSELQLLLQQNLGSLDEM